MTGPIRDTDPQHNSRRRTPAETQPAPRKVIRSDRVRYEGLDGLMGTGVDDRQRNQRSLRPARDAGLSIERRTTREKRRKRDLARKRSVAMAAALVTLVLVGLGWRWASDRQAALGPIPVRTSATGGTVVRATSPVARPTPIFASRKSLDLRLPVAPDQLTEVGFHQASYSYALKLDTPLPDADMSDAKKEKGTGRDLSKQETGAKAVLAGEVLRMWRDRPGKPNTAVDVGAAPGTTVVSPVDGTVVLVKKYDLYNKPQYPDYQIHIQPDKMPDVDVVLIHIKEPVVKAGDRVMAGITPIGAIRKFSDKMNLQLRSYTSGGGDHTHIQVNDSTDPSYKGLEGAITP